MLKREIIKGTYLHLSRVDKLKWLKPKLPGIPELKGSSSTFIMENNIVLRVSLAPTISDCLQGLQIADKVLLDNPNYKLILYASVRSFQGVTNETIVSEREVFDAHITNELWATERLKVKRIGVVYPSVETDPGVDYDPLIEIPEKFLNSRGRLTNWVRHYRYVPDDVSGGKRSIDI